MNLERPSVPDPSETSGTWWAVPVILTPPCLGRGRLLPSRILYYAEFHESVGTRFGRIPNLSDPDYLRNKFTSFRYSRLITKLQLQKQGISESQSGSVMIGLRQTTFAVMRVGNHTES